MSTRNEELLEAMWKSMIGVRYCWIVGCDSKFGSGNCGNGRWRRHLQIQCSQRLFVAINYCKILVSHDQVDFANIPTIVDLFPSAPHKPVQLVLRAWTREHKMLVQQAPKKLLEAKPR